MSIEGALHAVQRLQDKAYKRGAAAEREKIAKWLEELIKRSHPQVEYWCGDLPTRIRNNEHNKEEV